MRASASAFFVIAGAALIAMFWWSCVYFDLPALFRPTTPICGVVVWGVCALVARKRARPFGVVDVVRCTGWILIGCSIPLAPEHPLYYWPMPYGVAGGALLIVLAPRLISTPELPPPGCCSDCGYDLTGNVSGVCPECGERI